MDSKRVNQDLCAKSASGSEKLDRVTTKDVPKTVYRHVLRLLQEVFLDKPMIVQDGFRAVKHDIMKL